MTKLALAILLLAAAPLAAQAPVQGTLLVRRNGADVGVERYFLQPGPDAGGATSLTTRARYPVVAPTERYDATLERGRQGELQSLILVADGPGGPARVMAGPSGRRLVVKTAIGGTETGRELPGGAGVVLLDDRLFALFLPVVDLATAEGTPLTGLYARTGRRVSFTARRTGAGVELTGQLTGIIMVDGSGRLSRLEFPSEGLVVLQQSR